MKTTKPKFKSGHFAAIHSAASALHRVGAISKATLKEFDASCIEPVPAINPAQIKALRQKYHVSQPVFAKYLNTSESTVEKWERGAKRPSGMALKLLKIAEKHGLEVLT